MSEGLKGVPPEAQDFKVDGPQEKEPLKEETIHNIRNGPPERGVGGGVEAVGQEVDTYTDPQGHRFTNEHLGRRPGENVETKAEIEAGRQGKPIFSDDPNQPAAGSGDQSAGGQDDAGDDPAAGDT